MMERENTYKIQKCVAFLLQPIYPSTNLFIQRPSSNALPVPHQHCDMSSFQHVKDTINWKYLHNVSSILVICGGVGGLSSGGRAGLLVTGRLLVRSILLLTECRGVPEQDPSPYLLPTSWPSPCRVDSAVGV